MNKMEFDDKDNSSSSDYYIDQGSCTNKMNINFMDSSPQFSENPQILKANDLYKEFRPRSGSYFSSYSGDNASNGYSKYNVNTGAQVNKILTHFEIMTDQPVIK